MAKTPRIKLPKPHPTQQKIIENARRFNVVAMGEQGGKTTLGIDVLLASKRGALTSSVPVGWCSPTPEKLLSAIDQIVRAIAPVIKRRVGNRRIDLTTGGSIHFYSPDDGPEIYEQLGLLVIDDACRVPGLMGMFRSGEPQCLTAHAGDAWVLSGAYGKNNDFYRLWRHGKGQADWACWQFDSFRNPHLPPALEDEADQLTDLEFQQRFGGEFLDVAIELSPAHRVIGPDETFRQWCERLGEDGLKVDGRPFKLDDRPAMAWIYDQVPSTADEAYQFVLVLMKCAQVGFTVMEMLAVIYLGLKFQPATVGMFLPDMNLAGLKSAERFMPIVRTVPPVHELMTMDDPNGGGRKTGEGNVRTRRIGEAMFVFSWTSGRATTESIPMDVLSFDEVQEMTLEQMEKTRERLSASSIRFTLMGSTANWPDSDIHHWYKLGSQHRFHTECPHCQAKKVLDDYFPECIRFDKDSDRYRYVCASCKGWIDDPQQGEWVADNPDMDKPRDHGIPRRDWPVRIRSIHFPQFLSPTISAGEIIGAYNTATDMKNFFNRKLGKPYLDPSQVPVTLEHMANCEKAGIAAGIQWKSRARNCYMGIDQMGNFNVHVIKERLPDGRQAFVHIEETYSEDPFARSSELMDLYGVDVCVVEINPNYNDAKKFAQRHPGRVFICNSFGSMVEGMIQWGDTPKLDRSDRRTEDEAQDRYTLKMDQYKCMQVSMSRFTSEPPTCLVPDRQGLVQEVIDKGQRQVVAVAPRMFHHFTKTALVAEKDDETNKYSRKVKKVGIDPHFSYANMLCDVAWSRSHGTATFILPDVTPQPRGQLDPSAIQVPGTIAAAIEEQKAAFENTCGRCVSFDHDTGMCTEQMVRTRPTTPSCFAYIAVQS